MKAVNFLTKYTGPKGKPFYSSYYKVKATEKWVEYALDIVDMSRIIMSADWKQTWVLFKGQPWTTPWSRRWNRS